MRAERPSSTATLIAAATIFLARNPRLFDVVPPDATEWCAACLEAVSPRRLRLTEMVSRPMWRWLPRLAERATVPGLLLHFMLRKRRIEEAVRAGIAEGCEQVVVVGAGFDTLALRLCHEFPRVRFIEIDHPATQRCKWLAASRRAPVGNLQFMAADLVRERLCDVLLPGGIFRPDVRSVFVIEGLLMYLTEPQVAEVFTSLRELQHALGQVVFTVMAPTSEGKAAFHNATPLVTWLLSRWSEPFKSALRPDQLGVFLERFGYRLTDVAGAETFRTRYLATLERRNCRLAVGEVVVVAQN